MDAETATAGHVGAQAPSDGKAIAAFVLGIAGLVVFPLIPSIIAIIVGGQAKREIAATGVPGDGLAKVGVILGWVGVGIGLVMLLVVVPLMIGMSFFLSGS